MNPKLLIVLAVLIVAAVVVGVVYGAGGGLESCSVRDVTGGGGLVEGVPLAPAAVTVGGRAGDGRWTVKKGRTVVLAVAEGEDMVRKATIRLLDGDKVKVEAALDGGGRAVPIKFELEATDEDEHPEREFQVFEGGGTITLTCDEARRSCKVAFPWIAPVVPGGTP